MRVVSLVPSWTETLLECGVNIVGRTRYCVHPEAARSIPVVGGTKDLDIARLEELRPDLLLLDQEENLPWMAAEKKWRVHCTHVEGAARMPDELAALARVLGNEQLGALAGQWSTMLARSVRPGRPIAQLPGVLEWWKRAEEEPEQLLYLIWREPWMAVAPHTFVGSMLSRVGFADRLPPFQEKYPKIDFASFDPKKTLLLFSSEPYPFGKKRDELLKLGYACALVDGESYSWFGSRSLRFLMTACGNTNSP